MKYRKIIWILVAAVVLAGCSADDDGGSPVVPVDGDVAIAFKANVKEMQNVTRATGVINEPADMADNGFGVFCLYTNGNKYADLFRNENNTPVASTDTTTIMNNFRVYSPDGGASWTYGQTRYWPVDQRLSFFTYAPYIATNTATTDVTEDSPMRVMYNDNKAFSGKIQFYESNDPAKQHDILYGTTSDGNALTDWKYSTKETDTEVTTGSGDKLTKTGGIMSCFRHSTAKLKMFINHNFDKLESSNQRIYITRVELKNVPQKGELDITKSNITTTTATDGSTTTSITPAWSNISGSQDIVLTDNNLNSAIAYTGSFDVQGVITNTNAVLPTSDDYLLLLPKDNSQTLTDGKLPDGTEPMEIVVTYIPISKNKNGQNISGPAVTVNKTLTNNIEGNKSYTLNITLGANTTITLETQPWEENDVPQDGNASKMFEIPADGFVNWTYTVVPEDVAEGAVSATGYSYSTITTDGIVVTEPYYGDRTECSFQINPVTGKNITCKAELLECNSDGKTLTGNQSTAFTFEDNNSSTIDITPGSKSTLRIKYNGDTKTTAYARLRITVTYGGKEYIVYSLTGEKTYTEYTLYHIAVDNSSEENPT